MLHDDQIIHHRYRVERTLAHGGMATVYVVEHLQLRSRHALKVLDLPTASIRERLMQEGRIQASLAHPNIVSVTDTLEVDGHPALIMEFIEGPSLAEILEDRGALDLGTAERWFLDIVSAVRYAHQRGLIHRDLKPDNVLMAPLGDGYLVKVTDFGIAKVVQDLMEQRSGGVKTRTGVGMGTPAYMPPEQVTNAGKVDHRADIFALGCILYEMVTGQRAFTGDNLLSLYNAVAEADYVPPDELAADLPPRIVQAIHGCLAPELDDRIATCDDLLQILTGDKQGPDKPAAHGVSRNTPRRTRASDPPAPPAKRSRSGCGVAVIIALLVSVLAGVGLLIVLVAGAGGLLWSRSAPTATSGGSPVGYDPTAWQYEWPSAMDKFEVTLHDVRTTRHVEKGVMSYDAPDADSVLYIFDVEVEYLADGTQMPGSPWALVEDSGVSHDPDAACNLSLVNPVNPFRTYSQGEHVRGPLCFVGPARAGDLRLRFKPDAIHGDAFWFDVEAGPPPLFQGK